MATSYLTDSMFLLGRLFSFFKSTRFIVFPNVETLYFGDLFNDFALYYGFHRRQKNKILYIAG